MAAYMFQKDAGTKIPELGPSGAHTAAQSEEKGQTDLPIANPAAAARMEELLEELGFPGRQLNIGVEKETVFISGEVATQEAKEKVILTVGNIQGISKVDEQLTAAQESEESLFHTVEKADTLEAVAKKVLNDAAKARNILKANAPILKNADEIYPGMVLRIPASEVREKDQR